MPRIGVQGSLGDHLLLQQDDVSQHPKHLVQPRCFIHTPQDGAAELGDGEPDHWPGHAMVALL